MPSCSWPRRATPRACARYAGLRTGRAWSRCRARTSRSTMSCSRCSENREAGLELREQAVLFRTGHHSARLELELGRRNIPFVKFGGLKFVETAHVKDLLAFLRLAENPRDRVAGFRVLQLLPGIGPGTARRALALLEAGNFDFAALGEMQPPAASAELWPALVELLRTLAGCIMWVGQLEPGARLLRSSARGAVRSRARPARRSGRARPDRRDLPVARAVSHRAHARSARGGGRRGGRAAARRGLSDPLDHPLGQGPEWRAVYVLNVVDGCIPSDMATGSSAEIEEERRVLYVAMTRARDQLHLIHPHRFARGGQPSLGDRYVHAPRSRFIPDPLVGLFDHRVLGFAAAEAGDLRPRSALPRDRRRRLAGRHVALSERRPADLTARGWRCCKRRLPQTGSAPRVAARRPRARSPTRAVAGRKRPDSMVELALNGAPRGRTGRSDHGQAGAGGRRRAEHRHVFALLDGTRGV